MARKLTAAQKVDRLSIMREAIRNSAHFNGRFMQECLDNDKDLDPLLISSARVIDLLVKLRGWAQLQPLDDVAIQVAIDAFLKGAQVEGVPTEMGGEVFKRIADVPRGTTGG